MRGFRATLRARLGALSLDVSLEGGPRPLALVGPNGSGKSTILRMLAGALTPDAGRIEIAGDDVYCDASHLCLPPEARAIGYVPQGFGLFPHLSVLDNVGFGLAYGRHGLSLRKRRERAAQILSELDCVPLLRRYPETLSGGEQQRVALARALATEPRLLLLDEPVSALDVGARKRVRHFLAAQLRTRQLPTLIATHDVRDVIALDADVCVIDRGRVVQAGSLPALQANPCSEFVAEFVQQPLAS